MGKRSGDGLKCPRSRPCSGWLEYVITRGHWFCHGCEHTYTRAQVRARNNGKD